MIECGFPKRGISNDGRYRYERQSTRDTSSHMTRAGALPALCIAMWARHGTYHKRPTSCVMMRMLPKFSWPRYEAHIERFIFVFHVFNRYQKHLTTSSATNALGHPPPSCKRADNRSPNFRCEWPAQISCVQPTYKNLPTYIMS